MDYFVESDIDAFHSIKAAQRRIYHCKELIKVTPCPICKSNLEAEILNQVEHVLALLQDLSCNMELNSMKRLDTKLRVFTAEELSTFDGSNGKPAYVAVNDIVYDVSLESTWGGASHFGLHAGKDLTDQFKGCHGMSSTLSKLPKVGILNKGGV
jgi:predicted heme/steroid binding protein